MRSKDAIAAVLRGLFASVAPPADRRANASIDQLNRVIDQRGGNALAESIHRLGRLL